MYDVLEWGNKYVVVGASLLGRIFPGEGNEHIFGWWGDSSSKKIYIDCCVTLPFFVLLRNIGEFTFDTHLKLVKRGKN